jgi:Cdc6-like AAA superfamily ATPase
MPSQKPTTFQIENAFQPSSEMSDPARFAGRAKSIRDANLALMSPGANLAIIGNRGIGKTSFSRQLEKIASGDSSLLERLKFDVSHRHNFVVKYFACGHQIENWRGLLNRLLQADNCLGGYRYSAPKTFKTSQTVSPKVGFNVAVAKGDVGLVHTEEESADFVPIDQTAEGIFENVVRVVLEQQPESAGLLLIIDEFDQIKDKAGIGAALKALSTNVPKLRFCLVGVATDLDQLIADHESASRLFNGSIFALDPMSGNELKEIISAAENAVDRYFIFDDTSKQKLTELAQGHPYLIHLVGKFALRAASSKNQTTITAQDINNVVSEIAENKSDPVLEGRYRMAVRNSRQRETVLKAFVEVKDERGECSTTEAYTEAYNGGVDNPSQYVGQLVTSEYGAEIEKVRERAYRFKDSLFAAYVKARPRMRDLSPES